MKKILNGIIGYSVAALVSTSALAVNPVATLTVTNKASDTNVLVTTDLLCIPIIKSKKIFMANSERYTSPLRENPITITEPKEATWNNCVIAEKNLFGPTEVDHSKVYVTIQDLRSGDAGTYSFQVQSTRDGQGVIHQIKKHIFFADRYFQINMTHWGNYVYNAVKPYLTNSYTTLTVIEEKK